VSQVGHHGCASRGTGPNGLAAAVTLAQQSVEVTVLEAAETIFGGTCTSEKDPSRLDFLEARRGADIFAATAPDLGRVQR
jgi:uncharacterized protein with NAD-binding domain and iron-sulfur cluster